MEDVSLQAFCSHCGKAIGVGQAFCESCGVPCNAGISPPSRANPVKKRERGGVWAILAAVVVILSGLFEVVQGSAMRAEWPVKEIDTLLKIVSFASAVFLTVVLFRRKKGILLLAVLGAKAILELPNMILSGMAINCVLSFLSAVGFAVLAMSVCLPALRRRTKGIRVFWFVPAVLYLIAGCVLPMLVGSGITPADVLPIVFYLLGGLWMWLPDVLTKKTA